RHSKLRLCTRSLGTQQPISSCDLCWLSSFRRAKQISSLPRRNCDVLPIFSSQLSSWPEPFSSHSSSLPPSWPGSSSLLLVGHLHRRRLHHRRQEHPLRMIPSFLRRRWSEEPLHHRRLRRPPPLPLLLRHSLPPWTLRPGRNRRNRPFHLHYGHRVSDRRSSFLLLNFGAHHDSDECSPTKMMQARIIATHSVSVST